MERNSAMDSDPGAPGHQLAETGQVGRDMMEERGVKRPLGHHKVTPGREQQVHSVWSRQQPAEQGQDPAGQPQPLHTQNEFMKVDLP